MVLAYMFTFARLSYAKESNKARSGRGRGWSRVTLEVSAWSPQRGDSVLGGIGAPLLGPFKVLILIIFRNIYAKN